MGGLESDSPCVEYFSGVSSSSADQECFFFYCILLKGKYETLAVHRLPLPRQSIYLKLFFKLRQEKTVS